MNLPGKAVDRLVLLLAGLLIVGLLTGCSNAQVRRTPVTDLGDAWFCEMNESRDDWDCVRDDALARNPKPKRLPSDPVESNPFDDETPALPAEAASGAGLANPSAGIDFEAIDDAIRTDAVTRILEQPPEHFAVQLTATETEALADGFVNNHGLEGIEEVLTLEQGRENDLYYVILFGIYETLPEAEAAADAMPEALSDVKPWIRPLQSIQEGILQAQAIRSPSGNSF